MASIRVSVAVWVLGYMLFLVEALAALFLAKLAFDAPELGSEWFKKTESALHLFAQRRGLAVLCVGVAALIVRAALLPVEPVPSPTIHDEFSFLLAADTFAAGRLANPPHPLWMHFETMHEDALPAYVSMYPPAQGMILALGKLVSGCAFTGVWLSAGLMCAAICWMLQGWMPPGWALLGGFLTVIRLASFSYWADSYWGGALAATGGALVFGALPRILRRNVVKVSDSVVFALGVAVLLNSRPYEGAVLCVTAVAIIVAGTFKKPALRNQLLTRFVGPAMLVLLPTAAFMGYYNWRAFGSPLTLPYQLNRATYAMAKVFIWQTPSPEPGYHHKAMRDFFAQSEMGHFMWVRTLSGFAQFTFIKVQFFWRFFIGPILTLPLVISFVAFRDRRIRVLLIAFAVSLAGLGVQAWFQPHYAAPITGLIWVILLQGMRHIRVWRWRGTRVGVALVRTIPLVCVLMLGLRAIFAGMGDPAWLAHLPLTWSTVQTVPLHRQEVIGRLNQYPGQQLVIVRYSDGHNSFEEYVFNDADIDRSRVVWAREMDAAQNRVLMDYFKGRKVWLLEPDGPAWKLSPYPVVS